LEKAKLYKIGNTLVTIIIVFLSIYYLKSAFDSKVSNLNWQSLSDVIGSNFLIVIVVVGLVPINWGLETLKWKWVLKETQNLSWAESIKSVLSGVTLSIITPNGVGDYGGRMISIDRNQRSQALLYNGFLSLSQLLTTTVFGLLSFLVIGEKLTLPLHGSMLSIAVFVVIIACCWLYFKSKFRFGSIKLLLLKHKQQVSFEIPLNLRFQILMLSILRYLVFCIQYVLLIRCFMPDVDLVITFSSIAFVFLCTAIIPTGWLSGLLVRGSVSFFVFQTVLNSGESGVIASTLLWIVNLLLPAIIGLYFIRSFKLFPFINPEKV